MLVIGISRFQSVVVVFLKNSYLICSSLPFFLLCLSRLFCIYFIILQSIFYPSKAADLEPKADLSSEHFLASERFYCNCAGLIFILVTFNFGRRVAWYYSVQIRTGELLERCKNIEHVLHLSGFSSLTCHPYSLLLDSVNCSC